MTGDVATDGIMSKVWRDIGCTGFAAAQLKTEEMEEPPPPARQGREGLEARRPPPARQGRESLEEPPPSARQGREGLDARITPPLRDRGAKHWRSHRPLRDRGA